MKYLHPILSAVLSLIIAIFVFSCAITPEPEEILVKSVTLSQTTLELTEGEQAPLEASVLPEDAADKRLVWASSKESVAIVTPDGIVEALSVGTAYITATNKMSGKNARCEVKVVSKVIHVTGIALDKTAISMTEGEEQKLTAIITPENATDKSVVWKSGNEAVATVSEGIVKALRPGTATIQATTVDGNVTANCNVSVDVAMGTVTLEASHITCRGAELAGKASLPQTAGTDLVFGILYSTSSGVLFGKAENIEATVFDSEYNFSCPTPVLEPETTYYYRSYISQKGEIMYGEVKSFTTLPVSSMIQTGEATDIRPKEVTLSATLDLTDCRYDSMEYGFELAKKGETFKKYGSDNLLDKKYSRQFDNLTRDTEYTYRAYVKLDDRIYYGEERSFTTASVVVSITAEVTDVSYHTATISGRLNVESEGSFRKSATLYYSTTATTVDQLKSKGTKVSLTLESDGSFSSKLTSLSSNTKYCFMVLSSVDDIQQQTGVKEFTTQAIVAGITADATDVKCKSARISGKLTVESEGSFSKSATLYYSSTATTVSQLKANGTKKSISLNDDGSYSVNLSSLLPLNKYYYVVLSSVDDTNHQTEVKSFTTTDIIASITAKVSDISYHTATVSGKLTVESDGTFTRSARLYYSSAESTVWALISRGAQRPLTLQSDGSYSVSLSYLASETQYNYVVISSVDDKQFQTGVKSFTTSGIVANITAETSEIKCNTVTISGKLAVESQGTFTRSAYLYYSSTAGSVDDLKSNGTQKPLSLQSDGSYSISLLDLASATKYNYVVISSVDNKQFQTEVKSFTTQTIVASVTAEVSDISYHTATVSGKLTVESEGRFSRTASLYYSTTANTISALKSNGRQTSLTLQSDGSYSIVNTGFKSESLNYFAVIAKVDNKEFCSDVLTVQTHTVPPGAVDLGLSVLWASCNLGASTPEEYGDYYAWGETTAKNYYDRSTYKWCDGSNYSRTMTKYCTDSSYGTIDNKTVLELNDDAAHVRLGGNWRMPTEEEWHELLVWCSVDRISNYNGTGVAGYIVKGRGDYTDNWIFLPAAGLRRDKNLEDAGAIGYYWSSCLDTDNPQWARLVRFIISLGRGDWTGYYRDNGQSVRPVSE